MFDQAVGQPVEQSTAGGLVGDSAKMAIAVALSRITGLLRIVVAASILGSTVLGDLFVAVNVLPLTLYDVFAGSAISSVLVPPLVKILKRGDRQAAATFSSNALGIIIAAMVMVAIGALIGRSLIAEALTAGVEARLADDAVSVGAMLLLLIVPQLVLYAAIGVFVSVQHAHRRFLLPSAAPVVENLGLLGTIGVAWLWYGGGQEVTDAPLGLILTLGIGSGLSVSAHAILQFIGARRAIGKIALGFEWRHPEIQDLAEPARASFGWSSIIAARQFALVVAAGFAGAGGVQAFEIATLAYFIPVALIGRPIASAALPRLAGASADPVAMLNGYRTTVRFAAWVAIPAGAALVLFSGPLSDLIGQGQFSGREARTMLMYGLAGLGIGAACDALFEIGRQATMAYGEGRGIVHSTWIRAGVAIAGIPFVVILLDGPVVLLGLGLVVSLGDVIALVVVDRALRTNPLWQGDGLRYWPRVAFTSLLATAPFALFGLVMDITWTPVSFLALVCCAALTFVIAAWLSTDRGRLLRIITAGLNSEGLS